jgi:amino acid adenylation domain-containing protein
VSDQSVSGLSPEKRSLLERRLRGATSGYAHSSVVPLRRQSGSIPLSVAQEQLWYFSQLAPGNPIYNEAVTIRKDGAFDPAAFRSAFHEIVRRHEIWRTTFEVRDGAPVQVVHPVPAMELPLVDLSSLPRPGAEDEAAQMAGQEARRPYALDRGPLMRPMLVRLAADHHRLYLALHHLIFDGFSLYRVILPELITLYESFAAGKEPALPEPAIQYADYAIWSQQSAKTEAFVRRMEYWRRHLEGAPELQLPLDHARPHQQRFRGAIERVRLPEDLVRGLRSLGSSEGATLFQVLATAFAVLLYRYTAGQDDVVFGTASDLRQRPELEGMVGYCLTPVVVRADLRGDASFRQLLDRVRTELLDDLTHQVPFGRLVADLRPPRDAGINPLFQAMLVLEPPLSSIHSSWSLHQMEAELGNAIGNAKFDLTLELDARPEGHIEGRLIYNTDLFDPQTAQRITGHWLRLLEGIRDAPERRVSELEMLTAEEINRQVVEWNATEVPFPRDATVHALVARQVDRAPEAVAVVCGEERLTYRELDLKANRLAHRLRAAGADRGKVVGICIERSPDMVVGLVAILKSGAAYVPLDIRHPRDRLTFILEESGATVLLTERNLLAGLPHHRAVTVLTDDDTEPIEQSSTPPADATVPEDLAYILYTSGSTGRPKGVRVRHRNVVNLMTALVKQPGLRQEDVVLAVATYTFDMAVGDIFPTLGIGARLVLASRDDVRDPRRLGAVIDASGATVMHATPTTWQMLVKSGWAGSPRLVAVCGGDTLSEALASSLLDRCDAVWNGYGPTETTVYTTFSHVTRGAPITIGRPIANVRVYILDKWCQLVAVGVPGEIIIGGAGVSAGYVNRTDETAQRFVPDPFDAGSSTYRTGDLGRFLPDGSILHMGRLDRQVKVRGNRIELGEVEAVLGTHPAVADAVVLAREDGGSGGERSLVAYVVPSADPGPQLAELRSHLMTRVPNYMVPSAFVMLERLPLTPSGKIDRRALPAPDAGQLTPATAFVAPRTNVEERVAAIWARTLRMERVGVHDDFFEIGGHSLLAVRLLSEMESEFGVEIPLTSFFGGDVTVACLAAIVENTNREPAGGRLVVPVRPHGTTPILFFVHADESSLLTLRHFTGPLGPDQRVMGLLPERIGRRFDRSRGVEDLALPMLATVRETQPGGPYYLAGFSLGGLIAYEMAGRLRAAGEEVAWLGVIDAATAAAGARRIQQHRISWRRRAAEQWDRGMQDAARRTSRYLRRELNRWLVGAHLRASKMSDEFDWRGARALATRYAGSGHDAWMDLFVTDEGAADADDDSLGWEDIHEGVLRIHRVRGDHLSLVTEPYVLALADLVTECLREARRTRGLLVS